MASPTRTAAEREVLRTITPPSTLPAVVKQTLTKLQNALDRQKIAASVHLGGSTAKETYLKGDHDIDVFVRFDRKYSSDKLSDALEPILKKIFKHVERVHGSRDYFHVLQGTFTFEFVPVLDVSSWEEAENVTDMSPLHVAYVRGKIKERSWLSQDIRLTKQFCKAAKVYGAESYIGGFSGHVIDLLNIHYGGFRKLLSAAAQWPARVILDPEERLSDPLTQIDGAKTLSPLVIVDPVQQDRNSAAAVTKDAFARFREIAKAYLVAPPKEQLAFFRITPLRPNDMAKEYADARILVVTLVPLPGKKDVSGAKCAKVYEHFLRAFLENDFRLLGSRWEFTPKQATLLFALPATMLPPMREVPGPPTHRTADVARFQAAHETTVTRNGRLVAIEPREFRDPLRLLRKRIADTYVKERVRSASVAQL